MIETKTRQAYARRDEAVVRYVLLYGVTLLEAVSTLFFAGKTCGHIVKRLDEDQHLLERHPRGLPGGITYLTPRVAACTKYGAPAERANPLGDAARNLALGVLVFCCLSKHRRHKVDHRELVKLLGPDAPPASAVHVLTEPAELGHATLLRVYQAECDARAAVQHVRGLVERARASRTIGPWLRARDYGFAALGITNQATEALEREIARSRLRQECPIVVGLGPTAETLAEALRQRKVTQ
jgi:hypothetical protein